MGKRPKGQLDMPQEAAAKVLAYPCADSGDDPVADVPAEACVEPAPDGAR